MKYLWTGIILCFTLATQAQHTFKAIITGGKEKTPLSGATVTWKEQNKSKVADSTGSVTITGIADGLQTFIISFVGFEEKTITYTFPLRNEEVIEVELEEGGEEHE